MAEDTREFTIEEAYVEFVGAFAKEGKPAPWSWIRLLHWFQHHKPRLMAPYTAAELQEAIDEARAPMSIPTMPMFEEAQRLVEEMRRTSSGTPNPDPRKLAEDMKRVPSNPKPEAPAIDVSDMREEP